MYRYRTMFLSAILAAVLAACGDDAPAVATVDQMRVIKVSGDQEAQVPADATTAARGVLYAQVGADGYTDTPLVARVEDTAPQASLAGPSFDVVPAGTDVHWHVDDGCGHLFGGTTATDDSAYVVNRWAPGTVAGPCEANAGRLVGDSIVIDATWELVQLPGAVYWSLFWRKGTGLLGAMPSPYTADGCNVRDEHGNAIPYTFDIPAYAHAEGRTIIADSVGETIATVSVDGDSIATLELTISERDSGLFVRWSAGPDAPGTSAGPTPCVEPS